MSRVIKTGEINRPCQDGVSSGRSDGQLRPERETEYRAITRTATTGRCPVEGIACPKQSGRRIRPIVATGETIQCDKTGTVGVDRKTGAPARTAARGCSPIQPVA